jgi:hypothetical protein
MQNCTKEVTFIPSMLRDKLQVVNPIPLELIAEGDKVAKRFTIHSTHQGEPPQQGKRKHSRGPTSTALLAASSWKSEWTLTG